MLRVIATVALLLLSAASPVMAQAAPDSDNGRYTLVPVDNGFLRLDQRTGQISICSRRGNLGWSCHAVPDERSALEEEIARLQKDNAALKKDLLARGLALPGAPQVQTPQVQAPDKPKPQEQAKEQSQGPSKDQRKEPTQEQLKEQTKEPPKEQQAAKSQAEAEIDRAMAAAERIWRRLVEMIARLQRDMSLQI